MAGLNLFTNNAATTLASGITNVSTTITVATSTGSLFPTLAGSQYCYCTLANTSGTVEIVKVTARSGDTFTVVRGQDGTSALAWNTGDKFELRLVNASLVNFPQLDSTNTFAQLQTFTSGISLTVALPLASGGTNNGSLAATAGGILYTDGSKAVNSGAGTSGQYLKSNGSSAPTWSAVTATVANDTMYENSKTISSNYTITTNKNAHSVGPITINSGVTVTVPSGSRWVVL